MADPLTPPAQGSAEERGDAGEPATAAARVPGQLGDVEQEARPSPPPTSDQPEDSAGQPVLPFASVSQQNDDVQQEASRSPPRQGDQLEDLARKLRGRESESRARVLLQDMSVLRAWQQSTAKRGASHAERDAMLKVGTRWSVQGKLGGKKRPAADVAQELENHMIRAAQSMIEPRSSGTLQAMFAMSERRAAEPQTEAVGPCMSDASDAKKHDIIMNTTNTKPECSTPELEFQPQRAAGSAAKPLAKRTVRDGKRPRSIRAARKRSNEGKRKSATTPIVIHKMLCWKQVLEAKAWAKHVLNNSENDQLQQALRLSLIHI